MTRPTSQRYQSQRQVKPDLLDPQGYALYLRVIMPQIPEQCLPPPFSQYPLSQVVILRVPSSGEQ